VHHCRTKDYVPAGCSASRITTGVQACAGQHPVADHVAHPPTGGRGDDTGLLAPNWPPRAAYRAWSARRSDVVIASSGVRA